jgi:cell division protein FtsB
MNKFWSQIYNAVPPFLRNKYLLTILIFLVWIILLDSNNLVARFREMRELNRMKKEKEYFTMKIKEERDRIRELRTDDDNLEKFAREQYRMKKSDEDLFIIMTPQEERKVNRKNR